MVIATTLGFEMLTKILFFWSGGNHHKHQETPKINSREVKLRLVPIDQNHHSVRRNDFGLSFKKCLKEEVDNLVSG